MKVSGKVYDESSLPVARLELLVYHVGYRGQDVLLGRCTSDPDGAYVVEYAHDGPVNLQVRDSSDNALSRPIFGAGEHEVVNLVCPASLHTQASEHQRLLAEIAIHLGQSTLAQASQAQDITLLAGASGWDARLIALAAKAAALAGVSGVPEVALYALLRAGLTADPHQLARMHPAILDRAFAKAKSSRVAVLTAAQIREAKSALAAYSRGLRLESPAAPGTLSSIGELLADSGLNEAEQQTFEKLVAQHTGTNDELWEKAREAKLSPARIAGLQAQGRLAHLTGNNAPLMTALQRDSGKTDLATWLVDRDLHRPASWLDYLGKQGGAIPPAYPDIYAYAEDLARKVRFGLPTHVLARRVEAGELPVTVELAAVLRQAVAHGFVFGVTPARTFLHQHPELLGGAKNPTEVRDALALLHRVNQLSPDDDHTMCAMLDTGLDSAHLITAYDRDDFVQRFADRLGGQDRADLIYQRSELVSAVVHNALAAAQTLDRDLYASDFCDCADCGSVLSPAAYLVDLLQLLDSPVDSTAFNVLTSRRPDLPNLALTCENTNTLLPYIDVVNEILEFSAAFQGSELPARDVSGAASADLLAEPQFTVPEAYPLLKAAQYPVELPYDLPLDTMRRFLSRLDVPRADLMELFDPSATVDIARERLGLGPDDYALLTAGLHGWHTRYGYADVATARTELANPATLAARLGVSEKDVTPDLTDVELCRLNNLVRLHRRLGWPLSELDTLVQGEMTTALLDLAHLDRLSKRLQLPRMALRQPDRATLAKALRLTATQLTTLIELSGVEPDGPAATARLVEVVDSLDGLSPELLDYLLRHRYDEAGPLRPQSRLDLIRHLAAQITRIRTEHAIPADGLDFTDEVIAQKLALVLPPEVTATVLGMWAGTVPYHADLHVPAAEQLDPATFAADPTLSVHFDALRERQHLTHQGVLTGRRAAELKARYPLPLFAELIEQIEPQALDYFDWYLKEPVGVFTSADFTALFAKFPGGSALEQEAWQRQRRSALAQAFLPSLQDRLIQTMIRTTLPVWFDSPLVSTLLTDEVLATFATAATSGLTEDGPRLSGYLEVPADGAYRFVSDRPAELRIGQAEPLTSGPSGEFEYVELRAGVAYPLELKADDGPVRLDVIAENLPRGPISRLVCRPQTTVEQIEHACVRLDKVLRLTSALELGEAELRFFQMPQFPGRATDPALNLSHVEALIEHSALRRELRSPELVEVYRADTLARFATLTRRSIADVQEAATALGETGLRRLWRLLSLTHRLGVDAQTLKSWAHPAPSERDALAMREVLRDRLGRDGLRQVHDGLRRARRDALTAYLMHRGGFASVDELFAQFLVDPGTEPVVQTSRLRLAISSVQTFIQRCLMGLEPGVSAQLLSTAGWAAMKRYRVWEANRKIFLWPENWLEPEFRDDKSHLFQALEAELGQGDLAETADGALNRYLSGLDKIARLEIVSTWLDGQTLHVLGRTYHRPGEWFHRRYAHRTWTPWEPVTAPVEGDHAVLTVWRERPYVFWLTFLDDANSGTIDIGLNWASYAAGEWTKAESAQMPLTVAAGFARQDVFVHAETGDGVTIHLSHGGSAAQENTAFFGPGSEPVRGAFRLRGPNSPVEVLPVGEDPVPPPFAWRGIHATRYRGSGPLNTVDHANVLGSGEQYTLVTPPAGQEPRPFFYQDSSHTFYAEPTLTERPFHEWDGWILTAPQQVTYEEPQVEPFAPTVDPPDPISPAALYALTASGVDDLVGGTLAVQFGGSIIHG